MRISTKPIGSIPRPPALIAAVNRGMAGPRLDALYRQALRDTVARCAAIGSPVITIALHQRATAGDGGLAPLCDDSGATREAAFARIRARIEGTAQAHAILQERL